MFGISHGTEVEALIIGGGPAGASLATELTRRGRRVEVIEQTTAMDHKVCGEFISHEAVNFIDRLGIDLRVMGAVSIYGVRLSARDYIAEYELPFPAMSITRRRLDEALLLHSLREGVVVRRGRRVESLRRTSEGWSAMLAGGEIRRAKTAFLATGKHDLNGYRRPPGKQNDLIAFKTYLRLVPDQQQALRGWINLILFPGGYARLSLVENGDANFSLLVNRRILQSCQNSWPALLEWILSSSNDLARRLQGARPLLEKPLALSSIPFGLLFSESKSGLWRLGDQAAVIPSFSGDGMSIALHSAQVAAEIYINGGTAAQLTRRLYRELKGQVRLATFLSRLMISAPEMAQLVRFWPALLGYFAAHTRVPQSALTKHELGASCLEE